MRISLLILLIFFCAKTAEAKITIFACEPEWASLAREIVGKKAEVNMGSLPTENPLNIRVNNALLSLVRPADLIFCSGGLLEANWLVYAMRKADNIAGQVNPEALFLVNGAATKDSKIAPRVHLNPYKILEIAAELTRRLKILDAVNEGFYQTSYENFASKWQKNIPLWEKAAAPIRGMRVVISDDSWLGLTEWLGLEVAAKINSSKSFIQNNQQLNDIVGELKKNPAKAIIFANYEDKKPILWLSQKTKTRVILLPFTVGGGANAHDLFSLYSTTINLLLADCSKALCPKLAIAPAKKY